MKRTVSTPHLVIGIIFAGIALIWFIGDGTDAKVSDSAAGFPLVLIGAGVVGLVTSLANARTRSRNRQADTAETDDVLDQDADPTTVIEEN